MTANIGIATASMEDAGNTYRRAQVAHEDRSFGNGMKQV